MVAPHTAILKRGDVSEMKLQGKVAIITGARQGIGEGVALGLAKEGAKVVVVSRSINADSEICKNLEAAGADYLALPVDVGDRDSVNKMVDDTVAKYGKVDFLFNNAGVSIAAMLWKMTPQQWDDVIRINLTGTFNCIQAVSKPMMEQKNGSILNVTSSAGLIGTIGQVNYTASKGGVTALTKSCAKELAKYNIRVNVIAPMVITPMTRKISTDPKLAPKYLERIPLGRFCETEEVVPTVVYFASEDSAYVTGQTLCVDGGMVMI